MATDSQAEVFMIQCTARSGSTWVRNALDSHPDIASESEFLHPDIGAGMFWKYAADRIMADPKLIGMPFHKDMLTDYIDARRKVPQKVFGFDLKLEQLRYNPALQPALHWSGYKVIILERLNILAQFVSEQLMYQRDAKGLPSHGRGAPPPELITIKVDALLARLQAKSRLIKEYRDLAMKSNSKCLLIHYEDISGPDGENFFNLILDFLDVERRPLATFHTKQNPYPLSDQIENWSEVRSAIAHSEFAYTLHLPS